MADFAILEKQQFEAYSDLVGFILIKPDAFVRGLVLEIVKALESNQLMVVDYKILNLTPEKINQLYDTTRKKYDSWWIMEKAYSMAPSVALIVIGGKGKFNSLAERIKTLLGPTDPKEGEEWQIRYALRGTHRIFNLIHASDNPSRVLKESLVLFDETRVNRVFRLLKDKPECYDTAIPRLSFELQGLSIDNHPIDLRMNYLFYSVKSRLLNYSQLNNVIPNTQKTKLCLESFRRFLSQEREILAQNLSLQEEQRKVDWIVKKEKIIWALLMRSGIASLGNAKPALLTKWGEAIQILVDKDVFISYDFRNFLAALNAFDVRLSHWEQIVLQTAWICDYAASYKENVINLSQLIIDECENS